MLFSQWIAKELGLEINSSALEANIQQASRVQTRLNGKPETNSKLRKS
jgi:hypothetical protein